MSVLEFDTDGKPVRTKILSVFENPEAEARDTVSGIAVPLSSSKGLAISLDIWLLRPEVAISCPFCVTGVAMEYKRSHVRSRMCDHFWDCSEKAAEQVLGLDTDSAAYHIDLL